MGDAMKVNMDYEESVKSIDEMLNALPKELQNQEKAVLGKIGRNIKKNVVRFLHNSDAVSYTHLDVYKRQQRSRTASIHI